VFRQVFAIVPSPRSKRYGIASSACRRRPFPSIIKQRNAGLRHRGIVEVQIGLWVEPVPEVLPGDAIVRPVRGSKSLKMMRGRDNFFGRVAPDVEVRSTLPGGERRASWNHSCWSTCVDHELVMTSSRARGRQQELLDDGYDIADSQHHPEYAR